MDISVNAEVCHDNDAFLDEAADVCLAEAEGSDGQSPFVGATAAEPILEGLDVAQETEHQDVTNTDSDDSAEPSLDAESDSVAASTVIPEEPDWFEVGNSLLAMSQSETAPEPADKTSDSTESTDAVEKQTSPTVEKIVAMGFSDAEKVRSAVAASNGDIQAAIALLIAGH